MRKSQEEAVELRFWQRESALKLDGILRRDQQEWTREAHGLAIDRHLSLLHRLQQRRLRARRRAVHLIRQHDIGEERPLAKLELADFLVVEAQAGDIAGQQIGGTLDARERGVE